VFGVLAVRNKKILCNTIRSSFSLGSELLCMPEYKYDVHSRPFLFPGQGVMHVSAGIDALLTII
jgi:hypothetical protein